jgi:subtilisin family serine protease
MRRTKFFRIGIALAACVLAWLLMVEAGFILIASADKPGRDARYCVTFEKATKRAAKDAIKVRFGDVIKKELKLVDVALVVLPSPSQVEELAKIPGVKSVVSDEIFIDFAGKPTGEKVPWGVDRIDADKVWATNTGSGVKVAVLDTGIDIGHPDLAANIKGGINTVGSEPPENYNDTHGHGTMIAGIVAAVDNTVGVIGVGPQIWLYAVRFRETLRMDPPGSIVDLCEGMEWCILNGMQVINMSFSVYSLIYDDQGNPVGGKPLHDPTFYSLIQQAYTAGIVMVAAVGNDGVSKEEVQGNPSDIKDTSPYFFPASYNEVIGVSATGKRGKNDYFASFSNWGSVVGLTAPGDSIYTTNTGGGYATASGTSLSCPHVVGVAALVLKQFGSQPPDWVKTRLKDTAEWLANLTAEQQGAGLVDAEKAVGVQAAPPLYTVSPRCKLSVTWGKIKSTK